MARSIVVRLDGYDRDAQRMIHGAQSLADERKHPEVDPLHLLHRLVERHEFTQAWIRRAGVDPLDLLLEAEARLRRFPKMNGALSYLSPRMHDLLGRAEGEAAREKAPLVSCVHLMLALAQESDGPTGEVWRSVGLSSTILREALRQEGGPKIQEGEAASKFEEKFGKDLVELARRGELEPVIGRDMELRRMLQVLARRSGNNPLLSGERGIGKTAIVRALAHRIAEGNVPASMAGKRLIFVELGVLFAGAKLRSEAEEKMRGLLSFAREAGDVIFVLPDLELLCGDRGQAGVAALLGSALGRGEVRVIGLATPDVTKRLADEAPALFRHFVVIGVEAPTVDEAVSIVRGLVHLYEAKHAVRIADSAIRAAVRLARRYVPSANLPEVALNLIDEAGARVRVELDGKPFELDALEHRLARLEAEIRSLSDDSDEESLRTKEVLVHKAEEVRLQVEALRRSWHLGAERSHEVKRLEQELEEARRQHDEALRAGDHARAGELFFGRIPVLERHLAELRAGLQHVPSRSERVTEADVADVISMWTGVPVSRLLQSEQERLLRMEEHLAERVVGQRHALEALARAIRRGRVGLRDPRRPIGSFLFLGPTGVGKTELAKALAEFLFDDEAALTRLDMSEFMEKHMVARLLGAPPGYVDSEAGGFLTEAVRRRPYSVLLFDEMEKAHPDVFNILLQVLDDGRLTDSRGQVAHFADTVIIMTSNVGSRAILERVLGEGQDKAFGPKELRSLVEPELHAHFRPEFLNRIDEILVFEPLGKKELRSILEIQLRNIRNMLAERGIGLELSDKAKERLVELGHDPAFGARPLRRALVKHIQDPLAEAILRKGSKAGELIFVDLDESGNFCFQSINRVNEAMVKPLS
ncbi:MAG: AAA family ATPase [Sandaracinaceae bacterium]|nr:AAA family ATPase [Sandaracinaceae bacterium]